MMSSSFFVFVEIKAVHQRLRGAISLVVPDWVRSAYEQGWVLEEVLL
jgi:hypothetical protein